MRTIQITIEDPLLLDVDRAVTSLHSTRSAFVRQALKKALDQMRIRELEEKHRRGYEKYPVKPGEFDIWEDEQCFGD